MSASMGEPGFAADAAAIGRVISDLFRYAEEGTFISFRAFEQVSRDRPPLLIRSAKVNGDARPIVARAVALATEVANAPEPAVFAPPLATFHVPDRARQEDLANGVCLSVELDGGDTRATRRRLEHLLGPATMVVASGGEWTDPATGELHPKLHVHWRLSEPTRTPEEHATLYAARFSATLLAGGDRSAVPPCHPLRWPGSWHMKGTPKLAEIVGGNPAAEIHLADALAALEEAVEAAGLGISRDTLSDRASAPPQAPIQDVAEALAHIPNGNLPWEVWNRIGMATWRATGGSAEGFAAFEEWSAQSNKHAEGECAARWKHYAKSPPSRIGAGTVFHIAKEHGWKRSARNRQTPPQAERTAPETPPGPVETPAPASDNPFTSLGHDRGVFYFLASRGGQVVEFRAKELSSSACLLQLAPLSWWQENFPANKGPFDASVAADFLIRESERVGIYDRSRLRGRGAWFDKGHSVLHLGDRLLVDGAETRLDRLGDGFIYERARRLAVELGEPLDDASTAKLSELCCSIQWNNPKRNGTLFAGWLVVASVCGAMPWRPHAWISGEAGSGKSWLIDAIVKPILGATALLVQGKSTEAGIRGELGRDARPVVFDEAETQNQNDRARMQMVLDLARQASTEDGADIVKGTADGGSRRYSIRSSFIYSSINEGLSQSADETRTVKLPLDLPPADPQKKAELFEKTNRLCAEVITPNFSGRLLARTLKLIPAIRQNAETFANAIVRAGSSRRTGDTHGILLAGAYSLRSRRAITAEEADKLITEGKWLRESLTNAEAAPEWQRALEFLAQQTLRIHNSHGRAEDMTVAELLQTAKPGASGGERLIIADDAVAVLARAGLRWPPHVHVGKGTFAADTILVSNTSDRIRRWFDGTPWGAGWQTTLARVPDAKTGAGPFKFGGSTSRALAIPASALLGTADDE